MLNCNSCKTKQGIHSHLSAAGDSGLYFMNDIIFHWICGEYKILGLE